MSSNPKKNIKRSSIYELVCHVKVDGLSKIVRAPNIALHAFWFVFFFASCFSCFYLMVVAGFQYAKFQVVTTIRYQSENHIFMPTISLCNLNPFTSDFALSLLQQANVTRPGENEQVDNWRQYLEIQDYLNSTRGFLLTDEEQLRLADIDRAIYVFSDTNRPSNTSNYFSQIFHPRFFNCFVYNPKAVAEQIYDNGQSLFIFLRLHTGGSNAQVAQMNPNNPKGFYVFIQNSSDYLYGTDRQPILVTPHLNVHIYPIRSFYHQYPAPYSDCAVLEDNSLKADLADRSIFDQVVQTNSSYTQNTCFSFCAQEMTTKQCKCNSQRIGYKVTGVSYCDMETEFDCAENVWNSFREISENCLPKCPLECSRSILNSRYAFNMQTRNALRIDPTSLPFLANMSSADAKEYLFENIVNIEIVFDHLTSVVSEEEPKISIMQLIGILSGHLHLFLGISLLSFFEIFELVIIITIKSSVGNRKKLQAAKSKWAQTLHKIRTFNMDGLPSAFSSSSRILIIIWMAFFVTSGGICVYLIACSIQEYRSYRVTTTVGFVTNGKDQAIYDPPTITFCNYNPLISDYAKSLLAKANVTFIEATDVLYSAYEFYYFMDIERYFKNTYGRYMTHDELAKLGDLDRSVLECSMNGASCEFEYVFDPQYMICYQVKPQRYDTFQLKLVLNADVPPFLVVNDNLGFFVFVENSWDVPIQSIPLCITPGLITNIDLKRSIFHQYPWPYSDCSVLDDNTLLVDLADHTLFDKTVKTYSKYSRKACLTVCSQIVTVEKCECNSFYVDYQEADVDMCDYGSAECIGEAIVINSTYNFVQDYCLPLFRTTACRVVHSSVRTPRFKLELHMFHIRPIISITTETNSVTSHRTSTVAKTSPNIRSTEWSSSRCPTRALSIWSIRRSRKWR